MKSQTLLTVLLVAGSAFARADDAVLDWNAIANTTILAGGRPAATALIDYAVVHAGIHDAVQAYDKRFDAYATVIPNATGSMDAAVAKATHDLLVNRFPAQSTTVDNAYTAYLTTHSIAADDPGIGIGAQVASAMIALRANDGLSPPASLLSLAPLRLACGVPRLPCCREILPRCPQWRRRGPHLLPRSSFPASNTSWPLRQFR